MGSPYLLRKYLYIWRPTLYQTNYQTHMRGHRANSNSWMPRDCDGVRFGRFLFRMAKNRNGPNLNGQKSKRPKTKMAHCPSTTPTPTNHHHRHPQSPTKARSPPPLFSGLVQLVYWLFQCELNHVRISNLVSVWPFLIQVRLDYIQMKFKGTRSFNCSDLIKGDGTGIRGFPSRYIMTIFMKCTQNLTHL